MSKRSRLAMLLWWEPVWLLVPSATLLMLADRIPLAWYPWLILSLFLFWPLRWLSGVVQTPQHGQGSRFVLPPQSPITLNVLVILLWLPVNVWAGADRLLTWQATGVLAVGIALCVALYNWILLIRKPLLLAGVLGGCMTLLALISLPFVSWKPEYRLFYFPVYDVLETLASTRESIHANVLAGGLALSIPLLAALCLGPFPQQPNAHAAGHIRQIRIGAGLALSLQLLVLILLQSRGAYAATAAGLALVAALHRRRFSALLVAGGMALAAVILLANGERFLEAMSSDGAFGGWDGRLRVWHYSLAALNDFSVTGIGMGNYTTTIPLLYPIQMNIAGYPHAHNHLLQVGLDLGIPGLIAYLAILLVVSALSVQLLRQRQSTQTWTKTLAIGALGAMTAFLIHSIFDATLWGTRLAPLPWVLFALVMTLIKLESNRR